MSSEPIIRQVRAVGGRFDYYPLSTKTGFALLEDEQEIVLDKQTGSLALMDWEHRQFMNNTILLPHEVPLIGLLLNTWPSYVPHYRLLPLMAEKPSDLEEARASGTLDQMLAPLHAALATCNVRLKELGLQAAEIAGNGYRIIVSPERIIS